MTHEVNKTDAQIHHDVLQELHWDTRVDETEVGVQVNHEVVTLSGIVGSYATKMAAEEAAHRVAGVLDVADEIEVKARDGSSRSDTDIALAVRRSLEWDALARHENIKSTVEDGWVTLEGDTQYVTDSRYAERAVGGLAGVQGVINNLTVILRQSDPQEVRESIEQELGRQAERQARRIRHDAEDIRVEVANGRVSLSGQVASWQEKQAAVGAAGHAPGIYVVEDNISVNPFL